MLGSHYDNRTPYFLIDLFHQGISSLSYVRSLMAESIASPEWMAPPCTFVSTLRATQVSLISYTGLCLANINNVIKVETRNTSTLIVESLKSRLCILIPPKSGDKTMCVNHARAFLEILESKTLYSNSAKTGDKNICMNQGIRWNFLEVKLCFMIPL